MRKSARQAASGVFIDGEVLKTLRAGVDEAKEMRLALLEAKLGEAGVADTRRVVIGRERGAVEIILAIDEIVGCSDRLPWVRHVRHCDLDKLVVVLVVPVGEHYGADIDIILVVMRTVDNQRADDASGILARVVGMIPTGAILICTPFVSHALADGDRALSDAGGTVHAVCTELL